MNIKHILAFSFILFVFSCKKTQETTIEVEEEKPQTTAISEPDVAKLKYVEYALDAKTEDAIKDWKSYTELTDVVKKIKLADLSFFQTEEEDLKILINGLKGSVPKVVNTPSVTARILVLETTMRKLKSLANLSTTSKDELLTAVKEFLIAFSNVNFQMNKKVEFDSRDIQRP